MCALQQIRTFALTALLTSSLTACQPSAPEAWQQVEGRVQLPAGSQLPDHAQLTIILEQRAPQEPSPQVLAELRQHAQVPLHFLIQNLALAPDRHTEYHLHGRIEAANGTPLWRSAHAQALRADNAAITLTLSPIPGPSPTTLFYLCDGKGLKVTLNGDTATLSIDEHTYLLAHLPSASGTHYQSDAAVFWSKGEEAILTLAGDAQRHCVAQPRVHPWSEAV